MVQDDVIGGQIGFTQDVEGAPEACRLVAVGGVDEGRQAVVHGELELGGEGGVLGGGHRVVADLTDGDDRVFYEVAGQGFEDGGTAGVVRLLGVEGERAVVGDAVLGGTERFPAEEGVEVVEEAGG